MVWYLESSLTYGQTSVVDPLVNFEIIDFEIYRESRRPARTLAHYDEEMKTAQVNSLYHEEGHDLVLRDSSCVQQALCCYLSCTRDAFTT
jgi:hypothetical protein